MKLRLYLALAGSSLYIVTSAPSIHAQEATPAANLALASDSKCTLEAIQKLLPKNFNDPSIKEVGIDSVKAVADPVAHCEVIGHTVTQNPGPDKVGWSVLLPDQEFSGRYLVQGQGGQGGKILIADSPTTRRLLGEGFVFSSSDTGGDTGDGRWAVTADPAKLLDRDHRGAHVSVLPTKAIARAYYRMRSEERLYSYHTGCSAGGAMVMSALRYYPSDFDGAVAGTTTSPGSNWSPYILQYLLKHPDSWLSPVKLKLLEKAVAKACAGPDGLVRDPDVCGFTPEALQCKSAENDQCLTTAQVGLAKRMTEPYPVAFKQTRHSFTMTNPTGWSSQIGATPPTFASAENPWAPEKPPVAFIIANSVWRSNIIQDAKFDFVKDIHFDDPQFWKRVSIRWYPDAAKDPIWDFRKAGGKMITYSGLGENMIPPLAETEYYEAMKKVDPTTDNFLRRYELPGVMHCGGGPGPQDAPDRLLDAMIAWVEDGKMPGAVVANGGPSSTATRTVLLCPYPQRAVFAGRKGAFAFDATNWKCQ